ncbi:MAG: hypothetical protein WAK55_08110, partial [Xanthobacteraceae bacterium]
TADVRRRANLSVVCNALVIGLLFDGRRAVGVRVRVRVGGEDKDFFAGEIIVALGGVQSADRNRARRPARRRAACPAPLREAARAWRNARTTRCAAADNNDIEPCRH